MQLRGRGLRGISNTIAGLIVFTFVALALIPLLLNIFVTNTQGAVQLAQALQHRIAAASQGLNVTLDMNASSPPALRVYDVVNNAANDKLLLLLTVEDNGGNIYLVRPGACVAAPCAAGAASVRVEIPAGSRAEPVGENLLLHPRDTARIVIDNGKLLGLTLEGGAYVKPYIPPIAIAPHQVQYAAVAGSVKTNYFQLGKFQDLSQLLSANEVALVTDPASSESNRTILWKGIIQSNCTVNGAFEVGGFQPLNNLNQTKLDALFIENLMPYGGSMVIGGTKPPYTSPGYGSGMLYTSYGYIIYNSSIPAAVIARKGSEWVAILGVPNSTDDYYIVPLYGNELIGGSVQASRMPSGVDSSLAALGQYFTNTIVGYINIENNELIPNITYKITLSKRGYIIFKKIYKYVWYRKILEDDSSSENINTVITLQSNSQYRSIAWLDSQGFGLLLYINGSFDSVNAAYSNGYSLSVYCTPNMITSISVESGSLVIKVSSCPAVAVERGTKEAYRGKANGEIILRDYVIANDGSYIATGTSALLQKFSVTLTHKLKEGDEGYTGTSPYKIRLKGLTYDLRIMNVYVYKEYNGYDYTRKVRFGSMNRDTQAFGFYYYADDNEILYEESTEAVPEYIIASYMLRDVTLSVYGFVPGGTSGLMPYMMLLDTDGNGFKEIVFLDEDAGTGGDNRLDDPSPLFLLNSVLPKAGCMDKTLKPLYLKFTGSKYAINGSEIAQVSIQIRYTFHDNAGDDVDDVSDPKNYLMSFMLVSEDGKVVMTSDYIYQQLQNLEDTWPPNHNWVSDSVFLLAPNESKLYYVVFSVNDPYGWGAEVDDMDYTLAVEWLGMWYLHR